MTDTTAKMIIEHLQKMDRKLDQLGLTINGDGDKAVGLVRRLDNLNFKVKLGTYVIGVLFTSFALAYAEHLLK